MKVERDLPRRRVIEHECARECHTLAHGALPSLLELLAPSVRPGGSAAEEVLGEEDDSQFQAGRALLHILDSADAQFKTELVQMEVVPRLISMAHSPTMHVRLLSHKLLAKLATVRGVSSTL